MRPVLITAVFLLLLNLVLFSTWQKNSKKSEGQNYPEIAELGAKVLNFKELKDYFTDLSEKKGAIYAYQILKMAPMPSGTDMHLMGHVVGEMLYKQHGIKGISYCTEDFRNACSHAIVVGLLLEKGETALPEIAEACKQAPGGKGAYTMCYHGLGHGVLSYANFDMRKAVKLCEKTGERGFSGPEAVQCVGGTIMEIISGGDHDKKTWAEQRAIYLKASDPLYPCNSDFMPDSARSMCYVYLTPHFFKVAGADLGNPKPEHFKKAFPYCSKIAKTDKRNFDSCYGGFGKEFVVLAAGRDIRMTALGKSSEDQFKKVYDWCKLADNKEGSSACITRAVNSYFWGGENPYSIPLGFCNTIDDSYYGQTCFNSLTSAVFSYIKDEGYKKEYCESIPSQYQSSCQTKIK